MATGDDATAAGMDVLTGNELASTLDTEINKSRDYIAQRTNAITPIVKGGTGATTAAGARAALGAVGAGDTSSTAEPGKVVAYDGNGRIAVASPSASSGAANKGYVDQLRTDMTSRTDGLNSGKLDRAGGTITGHLYLPGATAATSGYSVAYINGDGRVSKNASSERYKKHISDIDPASLGDIWPDLVRYQMRNGDGSWKYGYIAEHLDESEDLKPFVVYAELGTGLIPDSIDFIMLLMAQNAQLNARVRALEES